MHIIKRNGSEAEFDPKKIIAAVGKANASVAASERIGQPSVDALAERVTGRCAALGRAPSVEEVQDFVEEELQGLGAFALSRHYIRYRHARELAHPLAGPSGDCFAIGSPPKRRGVPRRFSGASPGASHTSRAIRRQKE